MTIDERLEKSTERHEALTEAVKLMSAENRQRDRRLGEMMEAIARRIERLDVDGGTRPTKARNQF